MVSTISFISSLGLLVPAVIATLCLLVNHLGSNSLAFNLATFKASIDISTASTSQSISFFKVIAIHPLPVPKSTIDTFNRLQTLYDDVETLIEMGYEEPDESIVDEVKETYEQLKVGLDEMTVSTLLSEEYDKDNAILTIHAGAGGTESCDWASMLYRMYCRYADAKGFTYELLDFLEGDEAGYKSVTLQISGENAYGYLKSERGVHRLVRISPFNAAGKRQTSFVSCDVMPDIDDDIDIEINEEDLRIDTYRAGGAGGQHVNKTSSAVRITHIPTGIVVQCQNERSQFQNKDRCMKMLKSQLYVKAQQENAEKISGIRGEVSDNGWGSQIRSYVMQPYTMVKDHRTNEEVGNIQSVLDGNINPFINAYLKWIKLKNN